MTAAVQNTKRRPFTMIDNDCFDFRIFDNVYQKQVYEALLRFANSERQCFPSLNRIAFASLCSKRKVQDALKELKEKCFIGIQSRYKADGSRTSNLYTLFELPWLKDIAGKAVPAMPGEESALEPVSEIIPDDTVIPGNEIVEEDEIVEIEEKAEIIAEVMPEDITVQGKVSVSGTAMPKKENCTTSKKLVSKLKSVVKKEKRSTSAQAEVTDVSTTNNHSSGDYTTPEKKSQALEAYSLDWIKDYFGYNTMIDKYPEYQKNIDSVMNILHTALNTNNKIIRIKGDKKPSSVVKGKLLKLKDEDIIYAIKTFLSQKVKIKNTSAYMVTLLYNSPEQRQLDMENEKQHETAVKNGQVPEPDGTQPAATTFLPLSRDTHPNNKFNNFMERRTTIEELDALEKQILGNLRFATGDTSTEED